MADYLTVLTTTDDAAKAKDLASSAVEAKVAACAQIDGPITSVYRWEGAVQTDQEWRVLYKTTTERYPELEAHLKSVHDYDTPEIIAMPVTHGSDAYLAWVAEETTKD
ncbi:divalent-cation tolerance protein CutA [Streptomyces sp. Isolate_219]|uniref:divalent-cation tolerance protein CutA n=1 Tax=Streptomyces sp. Isolate_219 TaxID=2950110 RepID=UPI0021C8BECE|nr:divalent-cation tolerance protein CutA [Streptomyces sp. Isolate_219]MCR8573590.1 divalent-cation tolerance protein CutA [Streptomyces sp. Isolate_219]